MVSRWPQNMAARRDFSCLISTSGRAPSGFASCGCSTTIRRASGNGLATTTTAIRGASSATPETNEPYALAMTPDNATTPTTPSYTPHPIPWRIATVMRIVQETPRVRTIVFDVPGWPGHRAGQHVDVRLTAEDGYQTERSYSIASPPEEAQLSLTIERLEDGEVSPYLTDELRPGDQIELRGPIGGYFVWEPSEGGPLMLVAGGSGIVPL